VTAGLGWSRGLAGALIFSKEFDDIAFGMARCLTRLGALPETLVWDREGAIHAGGGQPTDAFAGFCGQLAVGWLILEARDPEAKGALERTASCAPTSSPAAASPTNSTYQHQLDEWCDKVNQRVHRSTRAVVAERLAAEREQMRPLLERMPETDRRFVTRVAAQPYLRVDTNDDSLDPRLAGRRVDHATHRATTGHADPRRQRQP
jgi:hypothetical protein